MTIPSLAAVPAVGTETDMATQINTGTANLHACMKFRGEYDQVYSLFGKKEMLIGGGDHNTIFIKILVINVPLYIMMLATFMLVTF